MFIVVLEYRDWRESKSVKDRVKKQIGELLRVTFADISIICRVERVHFEPHLKEKRIGLVEKQLNTLASKEIKFTLEAKKDLLTDSIKRSFEAILASRANRLGTIEERYSRFLSSEVWASLIDIQKYMDKLAIEFRIPHMSEEDYFNSIKELIRKIMIETQKLKKRGFWVNW